MYNPLDYDHWKEIWLVKEDGEIYSVESSESRAIEKEKRRRYQMWDETGYVSELAIVNAENDPDWARLKKIAQRDRAAIQIIEIAREHIYKSFHTDEEQAAFSKLFDLYDQEI